MDDYQEGLMKGKLEALEKTLSHHSTRIDHHEARLQIAERILYGLIGALALIEFLPALKRLME